MTLLLALSLTLFAADPARAPLAFTSAVQDKNFYLLSLLQRSPRALREDAVLSRIRAAKAAALQTAVKECKANIDCVVKPLEWSDAEIAEASQALRGTQMSVVAALRASGMCQRYAALSDAELLDRAWGDAAQAINRAIGVYAKGASPRYAAIDSVAYDVKSNSWRSLVHVMAAVLAEEIDTHALFFEPALAFALRLMAASNRDEAGRFEPLERGENKAAHGRIPSIRWSEYAYPVIVIPGSGTDRPSVSLSPMGRERLRLAARRWHAKQAPLLLVSGGYVHPNQTPHNEALEMKRALMRDFGVPENAILIDPHARHTTTNLRNAARLMWRYRIPFEVPSLITTDMYQSASIESDAFRQRSDRELGYPPVTIKRRTSAFDLEFVPRLESLHADASDLLDP